MNIRQQTIAMEPPLATEADIPTAADPTTNSSPADARRLLKIDRLNQLLLTLFTLLIYGMTMCRTIYAGDDGDFITAMATFGNCHPTGYPVFLLLGHAALTVLAPILPDPASRINALTVLCGSLSIGFFYRFLTTLKLERFLAATGALFLAFTPTLWQQSLSCEVYALTASYLTALLWCLSTWWQDPQNDRLLKGMTLLYGFACTNNLTVVLFLPGFLTVVIARRPTMFGRDWRTLLQMVGLFILPLSFYAYLPIAASHHPPINWSDPSTPQTFWGKITGSQYHEAMFHSWKTIHDNVLDFLGAWKDGKYVPGYLWKEFKPWLLWLIPFGIAGFWKRGPRPLFWLTLYILAADLFYAFNYNIFDIYVYYIPSYIMLATFITLGASQILRGCFDRFRLSGDQRAHYIPLIAVVCMVLPIVHMSVHYIETDQSGNYLEADFAHNILQSAPPNAIVITSGEVIFSLWYEKYVVHERPDVAVITRRLLVGAFEERGWYYENVRSQYPDIDNTFPGRKPTREETFNNDLLFAMMKRAVDRGVPVIWVPDLKQDTKIADMRRKITFDQRVNEMFDRRACGVAQRLYKKGTVVPPQQLFEENKAMWDQFRFHKLAAWAQADPLEEYIPLRYVEAFIDWGHMCERTGHKDLAIEAYKNALTLYDVPDARAGLKRLGAE